MSMPDGPHSKVPSSLLFEAPIWRPEAADFRLEVRQALSADVAPLIAEAESRRKFPSAVITRLGERGLIRRRWAAPGPYGDLSALIVIANELGRLISGGIAMGLRVHMELGISVLRASPVKNRFVDALLNDALDGRRLLCNAFTEPVTGSDSRLLLTQATEQPDGTWAIEGRKKLVAQSVTADYALVLARTGHESQHQLTVFAVPRGEGGYTVRREIGKHGNHSVETCELDLTDVRVSSDQIVSAPDQGLELLMRVVQADHIMICAEYVGMLEACLELAQAYLKGRRSQLGSMWDYQAVRHRFADLLAEHRILDGAITAIAAGLQAGTGDMRHDAAVLKLAVGRRLERCFAEIMELFGGMGYCEEIPIERALRDVHVLRVGALPEGAIRDMVAEIELPNARFKEFLSFDDDGAPVARSQQVPVDQAPTT
jgi:acyl-CoA dehydrogenase